MTDLEMTKLCGDAMGYQSCLPPNGRYLNWQPLTDDAQAMALVKRFKLHPIPDHDREGWWDVFAQRQEKSSVYGSDPDLNRAIVECIAKMQSSKTPAPSLP